MFAGIGGQWSGGALTFRVKWTAVRKYASSEPTLTLGAEQPVSAPPTTGTITVTTNLAGATFTLTGASSYSGSGTSWSATSAPAGTYTITYGAVTGYNAPPSETKTLTAEGSIAFSGTYNIITPTTGTISVTTNLAGATFSLTGASYYSGTGTSWSTTSAPAGAYTITYGTITGYNEPPSETKTLTAGGSIAFSSTYNSQPASTTGNISVSSTPSGASVYLDGSYQSTTPYTISNVQAGSHTITLKLGGYQDWSTTVSVVAGQTNTVSAQLKELGTTGISVSTIPSGAAIYLDSSSNGNTPKDITGVSAGTHYIEIKLDGYKPWSDTIDVKPGSISYVSVTLQKSPEKNSTNKFRVGPSVTLRPVTDVIEENQDGIVELFMNNPSLNDVTLNVDAQVSVPAGLHVSGENFGESAGAGVVAGTFSVPPGKSRTISITIKADKSARKGSHTIQFTGLYYPDENKDAFQPISLTYSVTVERPSKEIPPTAIPTATPKEEPGFEVILAGIGMILALAIRRR